MKFGIATQDYGSLPDGGLEADTPIFFTNESFLIEQGAQPTFNKDLSFELKIAFSIDDVLSFDECNKVINITENFGFRAAAPGIQTPPGMRQNTTVHWMANPADVAELYRRVSPFLPSEIEGKVSMECLSHRFNTYRYTDGQQFRPHLDGDWPGFSINSSLNRMEKWDRGRSMMSMLLYLNGSQDGLDGGETLLMNGSEIVHRVVPESGRALFFRHGIHPGSVMHAGAPVVGLIKKYVVRINVMYEFA